MTAKKTIPVLIMLLIGLVPVTWNETVQAGAVYRHQSKYTHTHRTKRLYLLRSRRGGIYVFAHRIRRYDRLDRLARRYRVRLSDLVILNRLSYPYRLQRRKWLYIPWHGQRIPRYVVRKRSRVVKKQPVREKTRSKTTKKLPKYENETTLKTAGRGRSGAVGKNRIESNRDSGENFAELSNKPERQNRRQHETGSGTPDQATGKSLRQTSKIRDAEPSTVRRKRNLNWVWPTRGRILVPYSRRNRAIEIRGNHGQSVFAAAKGEVVYIGSKLISFGYVVIIQHSNKLITTYAHNQRLLVKQGDKVRVGQKIAEMGRNRNRVSALRFEIRDSGQAINPMRFLPRQF